MCGWGMEQRGVKLSIGAGTRGVPLGWGLRTGFLEEVAPWLRGKALKGRIEGGGSRLRELCMS